MLQPKQIPKTSLVVSEIPGVVAEGTPVELVQEGFVFTEGPVGTPDGGLYFSDPRVNRIYRLGCVPRFVEKERRPPLRHQGIRSGGNLRVFENLAQTLVAVDAP